MHLHRPAILLALLTACDPKGDTATPDSGEGAAFHGQAWAIRTYRPVPPFERICTRDEGASDIPLADCWACVHLQDDGAALAWWGEITSAHGPYATTGSLDLGAWTALDLDGMVVSYNVGGVTWEVTDNSTSAPWTQTATATIGGTLGHQLYQPSGAHPDNICAGVIAPGAQ